MFLLNRYKLAAIQTKTIGIQVNLAHLKDITEPRTQVIEEDRVQNEIVALLDKNKVKKQHGIISITCTLNTSSTSTVFLALS